MCDNCRYPKDKFHAKEFLITTLKAVKELNEKFNSDYVIDILLAAENKTIHDFEHDKIKSYGAGKAESKKLC